MYHTWVWQTKKINQTEGVKEKATEGERERESGRERMDVKWEIISNTELNNNEWEYGRAQNDHRNLYKEWA